MWADTLMLMRHYWKLDRREFSLLQRQVQQVRQALRLERRDSDRRRG